jgi:hypothetical protein
MRGRQKDDNHLPLCQPVLTPTHAVARQILGAVELPRNYKYKERPTLMCRTLQKAGATTYPNAVLAQRKTMAFLMVHAGLGEQ